MGGNVTFGFPVDMTAVVKVVGRCPVSAFALGVGARTDVRGCGPETSGVSSVEGMARDQLERHALRSPASPEKDANDPWV
jgi:hypothetical protein